jgi:hypothetical protein
MDTDKLYPIAPRLGEAGGWSDWSRYFPGVSAGGEQVILFARREQMHAYRFDAAGHYLGRLDRAMTAPPRPEPPTEPSPTRLADLLGWADELGLRPATIRVRRFHSGPERPRLCVYDYPGHFEDVEPGTEEYERTYGWWHGLGAFVLSWDSDVYWINGEGREFR